jgi:redox-sensing transcriptional repressor
MTRRQTNPVSEISIRRLLRYLRLLEALADLQVEKTSSSELSILAGASPSQVRRDLLFLGGLGKRGSGYDVTGLINKLRDALKLRRDWSVYIVGAGNIGFGLANYRGFRERRFTISGLYDDDPTTIGTTRGTQTVRNVADLQTDALRERPDIAVIATPAVSAQTVADLLVKAGFRAILNFAPTSLSLPPSVHVQSVDLATELEMLAFQLTQSE